MRRIAAIVLSALFVSGLHAASLSIEGSYTTNWKSTSPFTFKGTLNSNSETEYEGEVIAPWDGQPEIYKGTITGKPGRGPLSGEFVNTKRRRTFTFTINQSGGNYRGDALEGGKKVGVLDVRVSGGFSSSSGGVDYSELVSEAVSKSTGISKDDVLELFKIKGINKDDVIAVCAVSEVTKGNLDELYKKKKKVNTNYEFFKELNLEKEVKASVDDLVKRIKAAVEDEKKKKK